MPDVGLVKTQYYTFAAPPQELVLECGKKLGPITVAYETYGRLNSAGDNAILVLHALTGSAHVAGWHRIGERKPGWWDPMVGPGRPLDTDRFFVVCSNVLGGCYGTTGPASLNPATGKPYGLDFPLVTIRDMVRVQKALLDHLGVKHLVTAVGGSMGGMQALEWGVLYPDFMSSVIVIAAPGRTSAMNIAFNAVQREAIYNDPAWRGGDYYGTPGPERGLALARMIGTITYKSDESWSFKFARAMNGRPGDLFCLDGRFEVENYLHYQGRKLVERFDANCYLYLTKAMDLHDVGRGFNSYEEALARIKCPCLAIGISSDILFPTYQVKEIAEIINQGGGRAFYWELNSPYGHDAFLIEFAKLGAMLREFLAQIDKRPQEKV
ncbi:MAG: homoserine O-acetyltransferase [Thermoanaerobacteraceae bacterium]|uniref:homoserine O-acetyltransferase MetX n=1 Tax=Thermanaeromonas sp. C210 TaxID=2731925 RepID=UPI00155C60C4|nr:homoserine O-acetyltransferase [Thermanaeromonas sp. C210]MBE3581539.1 homoserine O-acetyltransferase [Thermoanaerobacteraceae bacterium]GFN23503.1 homoserine O-acetyltransferase [Thermanaeromonas sp. C210]